MLLTAPDGAAAISRTPKITASLPLLPVHQPSRLHHLLSPSRSFLGHSGSLPCSPASPARSQFNLLLLSQGEGGRQVPGAPSKPAPPLSEGVNVMLRKIAVAAASKPAVEIKQDGDTFYIKTSTTVRTTEINFKIGEEFEEQTVDGRPCKSLVKWESENKMVCEQRLLKGEGPKTSWTRELTNDGELILVRPASPPAQSKPCATFRDFLGYSRVQEI
uniref:Lipocalin/cytosolic fatty-acid binding domain-containing protein n=1 Tax=Sus scrofa TaxID=9823 RepID=A0A8D0QJV5_PIG